MTNNNINSSGGLFSQVVSDSYGGSLAGIDRIPYDNTKPQITEGTPALSVTITPRSNTSILYIKFNCMLLQGVANDPVTVAVFRDSSPDAIATVVTQKTQTNSFILQTVLVSGSTTPTTFTVRYGPNTQFSQTGMGCDNHVARWFGFIEKTYLFVYEYI